MEQRIAALSARYDAIERRLHALLQQQQRQQKQQTPQHTRGATTSQQQQPHDSSNNKDVPAALQPCARDTPAVAALRRWCIAAGLHSARFCWVPTDYYTHTLQWRRDVLGAPTIQHLCKTIVLENTHCTRDDCAERDNARYYMVVVQYTARLDTEQLQRVLRERNPALGKRRFNLRLAEAAAALARTGYAHGAVVPFGTRDAQLPVVLSAALMTLSPRLFWVGGGDVACKCAVDTDEYVRVMRPIVAPVTVPLTAEELQTIAD